MELFQGIAEVIVVIRFDRVEAAVDHGHGLAVARQGFFSRMVGQSDRIADAAVADVLHAGCQIADAATFQGRDGMHLGQENARFDDFKFFARRHHADALARLDAAFHDADIGDGPFIGIEMGIEDEGPQGLVPFVSRCRDALDNGFQDLVDAVARLGTDHDGVRCVQADDVFDFLADPVRVGAGQVDFIDDGNNFQIVFQGQVDVGQGLGFDALRGIDDEQGPFAGRQAARYFVVEVDVPRRVDEIERILFAIFGIVNETGRLGFDGNAPFPFEIHRIEELVFHFPFGHGAGHFQHPVGQRRFAMVDMCDD